MRPAPLGKVQHRFADRDRIENVIRKPASHRNMPSVPVFFDGFREKWPHKVFRQVNAKNLTRTDCHIQTSGEVSIKLNGIEEYFDQHICAGIGGGISCHGGKADHNTVRDHHLLHIPPEHSLQTERNLFPVQTVR